MGYSLCNTLWGPKLVPCTVESTRFPLHDSLLTVRQTDIQSPVWMITLLLTMTLSFMCNLGERIHTPFCSSKKSQTPLRFSFLVSTSTEQKLSTDLFSFYSCLDKKLNERQKKPKTDQGRSGAFSKKQLNWIIWVTCWTKPGTCKRAVNTGRTWRLVIPSKNTEGLNHFNISFEYYVHKGADQYSETCIGISISTQTCHLKKTRHMEFSVYA